MKERGICKNCDKEFYFYKSSTTGRGSFCSRKCKGEFTKKNSGAIRICPICKKEFYAKGNPKKRMCCSRDCGAKYRKKGKVVLCKKCGKEFYKPQNQLKKNNFCSRDCANKWQARNKIQFICKICGKKFYWSRSRLKQTNPLYCSWKCRIKDKQHIFINSINGNLIQQNKKGLNRLELTGRKILQNIGIDFQEQVLMFNKFLVDVLISSKNLIIQWDGVYWHSKPERKMLDKSQDAYLKKCGYKVLRITDKQIKNNIKEVYENIKRAIQ